MTCVQVHLARERTNWRADTGVFFPAVCFVTSGLAGVPSGRHGRSAWPPRATHAHGYKHQ